MSGFSGRRIGNTHRMAVMSAIAGSALVAAASMQPEVIRLEREPETDSPEPKPKPVKADQPRQLTDADQRALKTAETKRERRRAKRKALMK